MPTINRLLGSGCRVDHNQTNPLCNHLGAFGGLLESAVPEADKVDTDIYEWLMNRSHSALTDWGLSHVRIENHFTILDVGCGGGRTIQKLARVSSEGLVLGIDYAAGSVATSHRLNAGLIKSGQIRILRAEVSHLPFRKDQFDVVISVESQYYWPDLINDTEEVLRVLKPGGRFLVIAESYKGGRYDLLQRPAMCLLSSNILSLDDQRRIFSKAGFTNVQLFEEPTQGWMCASGQKLATHNTNQMNGNQSSLTSHTHSQY